MEFKDVTKEKFTALLKEARQAHTKYEEILGRKDSNWAEWYADYILTKLQEGDKRMDTGPLTGEVPSPAPNAIPPQPVTTPSSTRKLPDLSDDNPTEPDKGAYNTCPTCKHNNRPGILFCENCGTNLITGEKSAVGTRDLREAEDKKNDAASEKAKASDAAPKLRSEEIKAVKTAGTTEFEPTMSLRVEIEGGASPILVKPGTSDLILGRRDPTTGAAPEVDLTPYAGYRMGVSRRHASLRLESKQLSLWDLGSSNGTYLNGNKLTPHQPFPVRDGDEVRLGQMILRFFFQSN